jgi:hypothetical protein
MEKSYILAGLAVLLLLLTPIVPRMLQLRIVVLRKLHFRRMAEFHESNKELLTKVHRALFFLLATVLFWLAFRSAE